MADISSMNPSVLLVDVLCQTQTAACKQTITDGNTLSNGTEMLKDVTDAFTGHDGDTTGDDLPDANRFYNKTQIINRAKQIAAEMAGITDATEIQKRQGKLTIWNSRLSLCDAQLQPVSSEFNNMNKAKQSDIQQDQTNLQSLNSMGSSAVGNITYAANILQQGFV